MRTFPRNWSLSHYVWCRTFVTSLNLFPQEPAVRALSNLSSCHILGCCHQSQPSLTGETSTEKIKDTGWDAVRDLITLIPLVFTPVPPQRSHQILARCFKATAELSVKWLVPADVLSLTCAFSFFLLTLSIWIADCNASVFLLQRGRVYIKLAQLSFQQA